MALRSTSRKLSFDILSDDYGTLDSDEISLSRFNSDPLRLSNEILSPTAHKRRKRKKKKKPIELEHTIEEDPITEKRVDAVFDDQRLTNGACVNGGLEMRYQSYGVQTVVCEEEETGSVRNAHQTPEPDFQIVHGDRHSFVELRQRSGSGSGMTTAATVVEDGSTVMNSETDSVKEENCVELGSAGLQRKVEGDGGFGGKLKTAESLDWEELMKEDPSYLSSVEKSPINYFMGEIYSGNSLRGTTIVGNEKERERVYDTLFRLPWRCELLIDVGFFVCFDSFLSLLTIMPARIMMSFWRFINTRQFQMLSAAELADFSCLIVLVFAVYLLEQTDISLIYHMIRGQGTIKLYVVYNVLEIFDRLCQNFCGDVLQSLFGSARGLASSSPESWNFWKWRFLCDLLLTIVSSIVHSFVLLAQAITLSTCIVAHNNALLALLVSNNFAEIKSNVFKRFSKENIHSLVYFDSVERFHISAFILFVLAQNILEAEGPWFGSFLSNALLVYVCEMAIDIIKHSFIAKFNEIKPIAYSEFLEDLCKQTLNMQPEDGKKNLTFVPLAPACVVIRVMSPVYAAHLPCGPPLWRLLWVFILWAMTYVMLASLKVMIGMGLQKHATWYVSRCQKRKHHLHYD